MYKPEIGSDGKWYPHGPGNGFSYYSGYLNPFARFETEEETLRICKLLNVAYAAGSDDAKKKIQIAIGL